MSSTPRRTRPTDQPGGNGDRRDEMSASTGTIRRPMGQGSILAAIAVGVATVVAAGGLALGALSQTATRQPATPVAAPTYLDRGARDEGLRFTYGKPASATAETSMPIRPDRGARDEGFRFTFGKPAI